MIVAIHQPNYLPWIGFFRKWAACDRFVLLDTVPFTKHGFQNRCRVRSARGLLWLTVPVLTRGRFAQPTLEVEIDPRAPWARKHWRTLQQLYGREAFFPQLATTLEPIYQHRWERLADLNTELLMRVAAMLAVAAPVVRASSLDVQGRRSALLCAVCQALGATVYLSGPSGRRYLDLALFEAAGIAVRFVDDLPFEPLPDESSGQGLSIVDALARWGPDVRRRIVPLDTHLGQPARSDGRAP